jgi:Acetyltransferases
MKREALAALHRACFTTPRPWSEEEFAELLKSPGVFLLEETHGFLLGRVIAGEAELLTLAVAPDARRRGVGRRLVDGFAEAARARDAVSAFLEVAADNAGGRALYAATGWTESGCRKGYYRAPDGSRIDALVLNLPLGDQTA